MGLDIEVSTFARKGNMPLPHDDLISITISNRAWREDVNRDLCYYIYTFGRHREVVTETGRKTVFIKAGTSSNALIKTYKILTLLSPNFVNIHNGFGLPGVDVDPRCDVSEIAHTFEERKFDNSGSATYWRIPN